MNIGAMYGARRELNAACELCDKIESTGLWPLASKASLKEVLRHDLAKFCMYLTASDGKVSGAEALFFKLALGYEMSVDELIYHIKTENVYSTNFESEVPIIIKTIKGIDEILSQAGVNGANTVDAFAKLYMLMGSTIIECDDEVTAQEKTDLNIYMNMVYDFIGGDVERELYDGARTSNNTRGEGAVRSEVREGKILTNLDFETITYSGFGSKVIQGVNLRDIAMIVTARHTCGTSNFIVHYYDNDGNRSGAIINEIGDYYGSVLFNNSDAATGEGILEIEADGRWELKFISITNAVKLNGSSNMRGHGDVVTPLFEGKGGPAVIKMVHRGSSNFIAHLYDEDGHAESIVNEIGFFSGEKVVKLQKNVRYFLIIQADGDWSIDFGYGDIQKQVSQVEE